MKQYEKWIVLPDLQLPYIDDKTLLAVEAYMRDENTGDNPFDGWLQIGDFLDFNELSKYNEGKEASIHEDVFETYEAGNNFLDRHQKIMSLGDKKRHGKAKMVLLEGNHDYRVYEYCEYFPKMKKMLDYSRNLKLKERGIKWVECWKDKSKVFELGNASFIHGNFTNQYHANKMVMRYGRCIYYGHTHDVMEMPLARLGDGKSLIGKSLGCLCDYRQRYLKGNPTNWVQAFAVFYVFPDDTFTEHTVRIYDHKFVAPNGKVYSGNDIYNKNGRTT